MGMTPKLPISQERLAWLASISRQTLMDVRNGRTRPTQTTSKKLGHALGVAWERVYYASPRGFKKLVTEACKNNTLATKPWQEEQAK